jgi:methyl-accepting chemotaxis protein
MIMTNNQRRNYYIDKKFQTKYVLLTILLLTIYTFIFIMIIFAPYILTLYFSYPLAEKAEAARVILLLHGKVWPWIGAVILTFGVLSIFVTHKVAGPLFRLKKSIAEVADGSLDMTVRLRKWDDLHDLAKEVNKLIEELRISVTALKSDYDLLSDCIAQLEYEMETKALTEKSGKAIIGKIHICRKNIEEALDKFKVQR